MSKFGFGNWDSNKDGRFDSLDLLSAFDTDGDQTISKDELQQLAEQLSAQLDYNSTLLGQLQASEQEKLACHKDVQAKQEMIKRLTDQLDQLRAEHGEMKRKFSVAQEVADTMSSQLKDARMEINATRREAENAVRGFQDMRAQCDAAVKAKADLQRALQESQNETARAAEETSRVRAEMQSQQDILKHMNDALNKEASDLRGRVFPLESDQRKLLVHVQELSKSLEDTSRRCEAEAQARQLAEKRAKDLAVATEKMRDRQMELQYSLRESEDLLKANKDKVLEQANAVDQAENKLRQAEEKVTALTQALHASKDENASLHHELDHISTELVTQARIRQQEQEKQATKAAADRAEMDRIIRDSKLHADDFAREAEARAAEAHEARQRIETKYLAAQKECNDMHDLVEHMQDEATAALHAWETQKANLMQASAQLQDRLEETEAKMEGEMKAASLEKDQAAQALRAVKQELSARGERFVQTLSAIQIAVKKLRDDAITERNKMREIVGFFGLLKGKVNVVPHSLGQPLAQIFPELDAVFEKLWSKWETSKDSLEDVKDDLRRAQLSREEERGKVLMLEEQISRLELECASKDRSSLDNEKRLQERIIGQKNKLDKLTADNAALEEKIHLLQQALQETSTLAKNLQVTNQNMQATLGEASSRHSESRQDVEGKITQLAAQLKRTSQERDELGRGLEELRAQWSRMQRETEAARAYAAQARSDLESLQKEVEASKDKQRQTMSAVGGATQKYQQQLKQNQDILALVQAQRSELQAQNQQLRSELDAILESAQKQKAQQLT